METALKQANAWEFVKNLDNGLDTYLGEGGAQISGGQKQRIAIARAILRNCRILLLDEATSALDRKNEREIQETLDKISVGRTTIIIAHRLSTIINAHKIYVIDNGRVIEEGNHDTLFAKKGKYYQLENAQMLIEKENKPEEPEEDPDLPILAKAPSSKEPSKAPSKGPSKIASSVVKNQASGEKKDSELAKREVPKKISFGKAFSRTFSQYAKGQKFIFFISIITSMGQGICGPMNSVILSNFLSILLKPDSYSDYLWSTGFLAIMYIVLGFSAFLFTTFQRWTFGILGENITTKIREDVYRRFLTMPIAWHEDPTHASGILATGLAKDAEQLSQVISNVLGYLLQAIASLAAGIVIGLVGSWKLTLIAIGSVPLFVIVSRSHAYFARKREIEKEELTASSRIVIEGIANSRTISSLGAENYFINKYEKVLKTAGLIGRKYASIQGILIGLNQLIIYMFLGLLQALGGYFVQEEGLSPGDIFLSLYAILFAVMEIGNSMNFLPDIGKALSAASSLFGYLDSQSNLDINKQEGKLKGEFRGKIEFKKVSFKYPSREKEIFKNLNLTIEAGQKIALVGSSGCGKSTILQLLMRYYDVDGGEILLDGKNIKDYDLKYLRGLFGLVSQEPVLFDGTIEYNIKYCKEDATEEEMRSAAEKANALKFIETNDFETKDKDDEKLGKGFNRVVGAKGS